MSLCGAAWLVDPFAEASFDAPKWFCVMAGAVAAGAVLAWRVEPWKWRDWTPAAKGIALACAALVGWVTLASFTATHPALAWPAWRGFAVMGLFAILGATRVLDGQAGRRLFGVFLLASASNAVLSLAQSVGVGVLPIAQVGGRFDTGALLGNEGYVALACAMMVAASIACALNVKTLRSRLAFALLGVLGFLAIVVNQQRTSAIAVAIASVVVIAVRWQWRWMLAALAGLSLLVVASLSWPVVRDATWAKVPIAQYQRITTYRLGAWIAARDMAAERPLLGYGPGAFGVEALPHRLTAEISLRERLAPPKAITFVYAHQEYLQLAAEAGIPALLFLVAAMATLFGKLAWRTRPTLEQQVLLALLCAGAVGALAWFPMHIPLTASVLLLCAGRAWRLVAMPEQESAR